MTRDAPRAVFILGPTASGKSAMAMHLARQLPVEIISVDSAQVYRGMDVGTAKPTAAERAAVPHHLIDVIDPVDAYSAAQFHGDASRLIEETHARGRLPLLVGGTMLYVKALEEGLSSLPEADANIRKGLEEEGARRGWPAMHAELSRIDPLTSARLKPNDSQRIQRALEVFRISGKPMSALQGARAGRAAPFKALKLALIPSDRAVLHQRIAQRFDQMLKAGLVEELRALQSRFDLKPTLPAMRCVGYRQAWAFLAGDIDAKELREQGIAATRQLAKRQHTWLRSMPDAAVLDSLHPALASSVQGSVETWLANIR